MMIQDKKVGQIIPKSSEQPSTSSKYDCVLDALLIMLGSLKLAYNTRITYNIDIDVKFDIRDGPIFQNLIQEPSMSSKYDCVLDELLIMLGSWKLAYNSIMTYDGYSWCQIWYQIWLNHQQL